MDENIQDIEVDATQIASEIASDLFGGDDDPAGAQEAAGNTEQADPNPAASPQNASDGPAPGTAAFDAMPKAWRKEMEAHWSKLPPEVRQYVHTREGDVSRGIQMYQQGHSQWNRLLEPYQQIFQSYPNLDPVQLLQGVMSQHLQLAQGTPEQKRAVMAQLLKSYGLEMPQTEAASPQAEDPRILALQQKIEQHEALWQAAQQSAQQHTYKTNLATVESFSSDPKNVYWNDVVEDIYLLIQKGAASNLQEAYDLACHRNPAVRAKIMDEMVKAQAKVNPATGTPANPSRFPNINGNASGRNRKMTIDDTVDAVVARHYPNSH
jgi:hypothetical protein